MFDVFIVGGGSAGLSAALILGRCRRRVLVLCTDGSSVPEEKLQRLARNGVKVHPESIAGLEGKNGVPERILFKNGPPLLIDGGMTLYSSFLGQA